MKFKNKRRDSSLPEGLFGELIDVLLSGWGCEIRPEHYGADGFRIFNYSDADLIATYHKHEAFISGEALRRGIARPWIARREAELIRWATEGRQQ